MIIPAYMSSPCHIELILSEKEEPVKKEVTIKNLQLSELLYVVVPVSVCSPDGIFVCRLNHSWQQANLGSLELLVICWIIYSFQILKLCFF